MTKTQSIGLSTLTQKQAYKLIQERTEITECSTVQIMIARVVAIIKEINGVEPLEESVWKLICHKDILRPARSFLWKVIQNTFKIGSFWECLGPQYAKCGECSHCMVTETMEYILIDCSIEG